MKQPEACISCGEATAIGSVFYSDRLVDRSGRETRYLCSLCAQRALGLRNGRGMTDKDRKELEKAAFVLGVFAPGGH